MVVASPPRLVRVAVGPIVGGVAREWTEKLYITFAVEKTTGKTPNKAKVEIYNLNAASKQWLEQPEQNMQVLAGVGVPSMLFFGELLKGKVNTERKAGDWITTLEAQDGKRILQTGWFTGGYPAGATRSQILTDALAANAVRRGYMVPLPERVYESAPSYSAPLESVLDELYAGENATWSIQGGLFQLVGLGQQIPGPAPVISSATGMIGDPKRSDKGVEVSAILRPELEPGGGFVVQSKTWSGSARITKIGQHGDTDGQKWQSDLVGAPLAA